MKITINKQIINKDATAVGRFAADWELYDVSNALEFFDNVIKRGFAHIGATFVNNKRSTENFINASYLVVDIDNKEDAEFIVHIEDVIKLNFVQQYAWFVRTSPSHTADCPRFHIYFKFNQPIEDANIFKSYAEAVINYFKRFFLENAVDGAVKDAARFFFGNTNAELILINENNSINYDVIKRINKEAKINVDEAIYFQNRYKTNLNAEHIDYLVSLVPNSPPLNHDDWLSLLSAVANYLQDDDVAEKIMTKHHPDFGKQSTRYKIKHRLREKNYGTIIYYAAAGLAASRRNLSFDDAKRLFPNTKADLYEHFEEHFNDLQKNDLNASIDNVFWYEHTDKKTGVLEYKLDKAKLYAAIEAAGFAYLQNGESREDARLIRIHNGVAAYEDIESLRNYYEAVDGFYQTLPKYTSDNLTKDDLLNCLRINIPSYIKETTINFLPYLKPNFLRDTKSEAYFTFINGVVKVTANKIELLPYSDFPKFVFWKEKIRNRHVSIIPETKYILNGFKTAIELFTKTTIEEDTKYTPGYFNDFKAFTNTIYNADFIKQYNLNRHEVNSIYSGYSINDFQFWHFLCLLATNPNDGIIDNDRLKTITDGIAYILHNYKDPSNAKIVLVTEITTSEKAEGGTGKSLIWKGVKYLRKEAYLDGKRIKDEINNQFVFQNIDLYTDYININDVDKLFDIESLYAIVTENIIIEKKHKQARIIDFKQSPKLVISTNYPPGTTNDSDVRRRHIVEIDRYFNKDHSPKDYFGNNLYDDWTERQWNAFYNTMFVLVQEHLQNNSQLHDYKTHTFKIGQLRSRTNELFIQFVEEVMKPEVYYSKKFLGEIWAYYQGLDKIDRATVTRLGNYLKAYKEIMRPHWYIHEKIKGAYTGADSRFIIRTKSPQAPENAHIVISNKDLF